MKIWILKYVNDVEMNFEDQCIDIQLKHETKGFIVQENVLTL